MRRAALVLVVVGLGCNERKAPPAPSAPARSSTPIAPASAAPSASTTASVAKPRPPRVHFVASAPIYAEAKTSAPIVSNAMVGDWGTITGEVPGEGCAGGFYGLAEGGFACSDQTLTTDERLPLVRFLDETDDARQSAYPLSYGECLGAPLYARLPTEAEESAAEPRWEEIAQTVAEARKAALAGRDADVPRELRGVDLTTALEPCASVLHGALPKPDGDAVRIKLPRGVGVAWLAACEDRGRGYLITPDLGFLPADRVAREPASAYHGTDLTKVPDGMALAFVVRKARPRYRMTKEGGFELSGTSWPVGSALLLTGGYHPSGEFTYWATNDEDFYVLREHVAVIEVVPRPNGVGEKDRWLDLRASTGVLVAYEGDHPVYGTLAVSPVAHVEVSDSLGYRGRGQFRIDQKVRARTVLTGPHDVPTKQTRFWLPNAQTFGEAFTLVGDPYDPPLGSTTASGLVRVAPADAAWLFAFTEPSVPAGWSSRKAAAGRGTLIQIRE